MVLNPLSAPNLNDIYSLLIIPYTAIDTSQMTASSNSETVPTSQPIVYLINANLESGGSAQDQSNYVLNTLLFSGIGQMSPWEATKVYLEYQNMSYLLASNLNITA